MRVWVEGGSFFCVFAACDSQVEVGRAHALTHEPFLNRNNHHHVLGSRAAFYFKSAAHLQPTAVHDTRATIYLRWYCALTMNDLARLEPNGVLLALIMQTP